MAQDRLLTRNFGFLWTGQLISQTGDGVTKLALLWFVYSVTGSPLKTTIIGMLQTLPPIFLGPFIGVLVDRVPKKPLLVSIDVLRALLIGVVPCVLLPESFTVERLYGLVLLHAVATAIGGPAIMSTIPRIVPRERFTAANGLMQTTTSLGVIMGPALSGIGIAALNAQEVLCLATAPYIFSAACYACLRLPPHYRLERREDDSAMGDLMAGLRFAFQPMIVLLIATAAMDSFGTAAFSTLFPVFGRKMLDLGPVEVGYFWSAFGSGLFLTSIALVRLPVWRIWQRINFVAAAAALTSLALAALTFAPGRWSAAACMVIVGMGFGAFTPIAWGVLQEMTPPELVGRILTIYNSCAMTAAISGMTAFGWVTEKWDERGSVIGIAIILTMTAIFAAGFSRWARRAGAVEEAAVNYRDEAVTAR
jgi:MFS family permease